MTADERRQRISRFCDVVERFVSDQIDRELDRAERYHVTGIWDVDEALQACFEGLPEGPSTDVQSPDPAPPHPTTQEVP